jgi:lipopolysaccharide transport system ATP-binding protein
MATEPVQRPHIGSPVIAPQAEPEAIRVSGAGKCYHIYDRPQDRLKEALWQRRKLLHREFWALRNVSFTVQRGESVGIIGRNGCGKSTLLQIIAGTMTPSEGEVRVSGRVSALLELGSGFNPEFTGRENVYLNAAILGIPRQDMEQRFAEIAAFADIGEFIDRPVKTYSSGMHARLAFSVAVAVDPDILIVDEILAVGDVGFQQKCIGRLRRLRENGMTLLFVTHSPDAIRSVCQKALFLVDGQAAYFGTADRAVDLYLARVREESNREMLAIDAEYHKPIRFETQIQAETRYGTGHVQIERVELYDAGGAPCRAFRFGDTIMLTATIRALQDARDLSVSFLVRDQTGVDLLGTTTFDERVNLPAIPRGGRANVRFRFTNTLRNGNFGVSLAVNRVSSRDYSDNILFDQADACVAFSVIADPDRPVHYKFHQPVAIEVSLDEHGSA